MSKITITTKAGVTKEVDNTNTGVVFPYSDTQMIGPFQFDAPDKELTARLGVPNAEKMLHFSVTKGEEVLLKGNLKLQDINKPTKSGNPGPILRGVVVDTATGESIAYTGWKKKEDGEDGREYIQFRPDNRPYTGRCFV